ncbi:hypothetical protein [Pseudomonas sp. QD4]|uniref:hypothetical protein n=1 Tax=Pseudomonas sp. QD4 TaxID=3368618 RepID=UPI003B9EEDEE
MGASTVSPHVNTSAAQSWLLWAGFILVSLNLRLIFTTVGPLLENLQLGFTSTLLVTTLPLALLGLFSMAGVRLRHWLGEERALFFARHGPGSGHGGPGVNVCRDPTAWAITLFCGLQVLNLYVFLP